jgi:hypothetical protein
VLEVAVAISNGQTFKALLIEKTTLVTLSWLQSDVGKRAATSTGTPNPIAARETAKTRLRKLKETERKRSRGLKKGSKML